MNTQVSFEIAKLLKEKGFDERSKPFRYNKEGELVLLEGINAPTIAEVVMWLYEKHGIWIYADFGLGWEGFTIPCGYSGKATTSKLHWNGKNYNSPTEAYEAAIEYILNNLL